jgi:hypothetical protein
MKKKEYQALFEKLKADSASDQDLAEIISASTALESVIDDLSEEPRLKVPFVNATPLSGTKWG